MNSKEIFCAGGAYILLLASSQRFNYFWFPMRHRATEAQASISSEQKYIQGISKQALYF
jgi:hypothetical protein